MKKNLHNIDRGIRIGIFAVAAILILTNVVTGWLAIGLGLFGAIMGITSMVSFCPLYALFGVSTCPVEPGEGK